MFRAFVQLGLSEPEVNLVEGPIKCVSFWIRHNQVGGVFP